MTTVGRAARPVRAWDIVLTIVFLVILASSTLLASYAGLFLVMASDSCGASSVCNSTLLTLGVFIAAGGVWIVFLAALVVSIVLLALRRIAFWVPLAGLVAMGLVFASGAALTFAAVDQL